MLRDWVTWPSAGQNYILVMWYDMSWFDRTTSKIREMWVTLLLKSQLWLSQSKNLKLHQLAAKVSSQWKKWLYSQIAGKSCFATNDTQNQEEEEINSSLPCALRRNLTKWSHVSDSNSTWALHCNHNMLAAFCVLCQRTLSSKVKNCKGGKSVATGG